MLKTVASKSRKLSENVVLDKAIQQLLRATKNSADEKGKPLAREDLRKEGYSERFIDKLDKA